MNLEGLLRTIPDFPKPGIQFKDVESITENPDAFSYVIDQFAEQAADHKIDRILGLDARGFIFGAALAYKMRLPFVMARKQGKLGGECVSQTYALEYGEAHIELQWSAIEAGNKVFIVDDLLATGGTAAAAAALVNQIGAHTTLFGFVVELEGLNGRGKLTGVDIVSLIKCD